MLAQAPTSSCTDDFLANITTCRIDAPIVTQRITEYDGAFHPEIFLAVSNDSDEQIHGVQLPRIFLKPNDKVTIDANGCVQTGGHGSTWKRYVDPLQDGNEDIYHGTLGVQNARLADGTTMLNPIRLQDVRQLTFWVPAGQNLRLGYEDGDYSDNGYWGHDDGDPEQCNLDGSHGFGGNAFVTLTIQHNTPPPPTLAPFCWDHVAADPNLPDPYDHANPYDMNALFLNPRWGWQTAPRGADPTLLCGAPVAAVPDFDSCPTPSSCTRDLVSADTPDTFFNGLFDGCGNGHLNWDIVTYHGPIFWHDHSASTFGDDDYNFELHTPVTNGFPSGVTAANTAEIQLEFQARETIDHFDNIPFWHDFHLAVDNNDREAHIKVDGKEAIVIGLLGLDRVHGSIPEIHPVFVLAIHVRSLPSDDVWAIFARNYGNEGWCSDNMDYTTFNTVMLRLPRPASTLVPVTAQAMPSGQTTFVASSSDVTGWDFFSGPNQDTFVTFNLPSPPADGDDGARVAGELHLQWSAATGGPASVFSTQESRAALDTTSSDQAAPVPQEITPEDTLHNMWAQLTPRQQANYLAILPPRLGVLSDTFHLVPNVMSQAPEPAVIKPTLSAVTNPRQRAYKQEIVMSYCGATRGQPGIDPATCAAGDVTGDGKADCSDLAIVEASFLKQFGQPGFDLRADFNGDGVVDLKDIAIVAQSLPAGTQCSGFTMPRVTINGPTETFYRQVRLSAIPSDPTFTFAWRALTKSAAIVNADTSTPDIQFAEGAGTYTLEVKATNVLGASATATISINYVGR
jgi:hypothetical protein